MRCFVFLMMCISVAYCIPPRPAYSPNYSQVTIQRSIEIPYPGDRPVATQGRFLARQEAPKPSYGPPPQAYGPPPQEYGPPKANETQTNNETSTNYPTTEAYSEQVNFANTQKKQDSKSDAPVEGGMYYIYHPNGVLQKVVYATKDDIKNMAYFARIKYENVEPIVDPVYTYDPDTLVLQRIVV